MGFPSPASDYAQSRLDVCDYLVQHPAATFFMRAESNSMVRAGISAGDILVVDRSVKPAHGNIVIASLDGDFHVRQLRCREQAHFLVAADPRIKPLPVDDLDYVIWGVVMFSIKRMSAVPSAPAAG